MTKVGPTRLSENEQLVRLLKTPPFPNMATVEVATRCGIRALSGFSALDPDDRSEGNDWPPSSADTDILFCLRVLATCTSIIRWQDEHTRIYLREGFSPIKLAMVHCLAIFLPCRLVLISQFL